MRARGPDLHWSPRWTVSDRWTRFNLQHHSHCEFTGEKTPRTQRTHAYAAEMNRDELAFVRWTYGPVRSC